jgi:hypothetical protein
MTPTSARDAVYADWLAKLSGVNEALATLTDLIAVGIQSLDAYRQTLPTKAP